MVVDWRDKSSFVDKSSFLERSKGASVPQPGEAAGSVYITGTVVYLPTPLRHGATTILCVFVSLVFHQIHAESFSHVLSAGKSWRDDRLLCSFWLLSTAVYGAGNFV